MKKLLLINYHYIREVSQNQGIFPVTIERIFSQLECLREQYGFQYCRNIEDFFSSDSCGLFFHLTFDDGLAEQFGAARKLAAAGFPPSMYVSTGKYQTHQPDRVHVIHLLKEIYGIEEFNKAVRREIEVDIGFRDSAIAQYRYDSESDALIKYQLNFCDDSRIDDSLQRMLPKSAKRYIDGLYLSASQIKIASKFCTIGSHLKNHIPIGTRSLAEQEDQLASSKCFLEEITGRSVDVVSFPYGGPSALPDQQVAGKYYDFGLSMSRGINPYELADRLLLNRIDTNDAPRGKNFNEEIFRPWLT